MTLLAGQYHFDARNVSGTTCPHSDGVNRAGYRVSGVGLLLLTMTNRYGRVTALAREIIRDLETIADTSRYERFVQQLRIVYRRARILRLAIIMASLCILFVTFTVFSPFAGQVLGTGMDFSLPCFGLSLLSLLASLYSFMRDVGISLTALELETGPYVNNLDLYTGGRDDRARSGISTRIVAAEYDKIAKAALVNN